MTPLQNMPGKIIGGDSISREIVIELAIWPLVHLGDAVIVSSVQESAPLVGDWDRKAVRRFLKTFLVSKFAGMPFEKHFENELAVAFARHREDAMG